MKIEFLDARNLDDGTFWLGYLGMEAPRRGERVVFNWKPGYKEGPNVFRVIDVVHEVTEGFGQTTVTVIVLPEEPNIKIMLSQGQIEAIFREWDERAFRGNWKENPPNPTQSAALFIDIANSIK